MKIFLISPVRNIEADTKKRIATYVASLEGEGHVVHWPIRDTRQDDPTGGFEICKANFAQILEADEIHIWYDETSSGSKFDMGGVFMLMVTLGREKTIVIANEAEIVDVAPKSFYKVFKHLIERTVSQS